MIKKMPYFYAVLAALFYALSTPFSKVLMETIPSTLLAGFLYLGAGAGMGVIYIFRKLVKIKDEEPSLEKKDTKYVVLMILLDIIAPILLLLGLSLSSPAVVSLINNFEIVATSLIALMIFKEIISKKMWIGISLITIASILLSVNLEGGIHFNLGSLFCILACICWGVENNCTRRISLKNPFQIVILKGIFSGLGSLIIGLLLKEKITDFNSIIYALLLGFVAYGLSVFFYVKAQRYLGASKVSSFYALAPFFSVFISFIIDRSMPYFLFYIALVTMMIAMIFIFQDKSNNELKMDSSEGSNG